MTTSQNLTAEAAALIERLYRAHCLAFDERKPAQMQRIAGAWGKARSRWARRHFNRGFEQAA